MLQSLSKAGFESPFVVGSFVMDKIKSLLENRKCIRYQKLKLITFLLLKKIEDMVNNEYMKLTILLLIWRRRRSIQINCVVRVLGKFKFLYVASSSGFTIYWS